MSNFVKPSNGSLRGTFVLNTDIASGSATSGQVLTADGSGNSNWTTVSGSSPLTTKGDIYIYTTTNDRLPIGTDTYVLTADSTQSAGMKWAAPSGGGGGSFVGAQVYLSSNQNISNGLTTVLFDTIVYDTNSAYNTSTGVYTIPVTGYYLITTNLFLDNHNNNISTSDYILPAITVSSSIANGAELTGLYGFNNVGTFSLQYTMGGSSVMKLNSGDTVKITLYTSLSNTNAARLSGAAGTNGVVMSISQVAASGGGGTSFSGFQAEISSPITSYWNAGGNTAIVFDSSNFSSGSDLSYNTSTGTITFNTAGQYYITVFLRYSNVSGTIVGGAQQAILDLNTITGSITTNGLFGSSVVFPNGVIGATSLSGGAMEGTVLVKVTAGTTANILLSTPATPGDLQAGTLSIQFLGS